ncbi:MAG TPA: NAD-dependent epimerase/dehydratase family protein [Blastocatellia bacterium]|nr:NAD-dependent epimerase/dehydratase family protein [Blastocatellia bacterium]
MRILITGGAGFVGSNLAIALKTAFPAAEVVCLDNLYRRGSELNLPRLRAGEIRFLHGDVRDRDSFPPGPFDFLIEASAEPSVMAGLDGSPDYLIQSNLMGAYHCLEKARLWKSRFLFLSTSRVYPIQRLESHPYREEATRFCWEDQATGGISSSGVSELADMSGPRSLYGYTKYAAEQLIEEYRAAFGVKAVVNRCGVIAGPWQFGRVDQGVAALWVLAHHFRRSLSYIGYGGMGKQVRDFLHASDLCDLVVEQVREFDQWDGWVGNVAGGASNSASLCELTTLCREIVGHTIPISSVPANRPADLRIYIGDCARLFSRTAWRPKRDVRRIVQDIAVWVREYSAALEAL